MVWLVVVVTTCLELECEVEEFGCDDGTKCIPTRWLCDSHLDCLDGSDEISCLGLSPQPPCSPGELACADGSCLDLVKHCDGHRDCEDNSDEGPFCEEEGCEQLDCSHQCRQTRRGPHCYCPPGGASS